MKRDEVLAMTDDQLRIKAAELMGWTECYVDRGEPFGVVPELYTGYPYSEILPDYPNDIDAAWTLWERLDEEGMYVMLRSGSVCPNGDYKRETTALIWRDGLDSIDVVDSEIAVKSAPRAITRAFIMAMELTNAN